MLCGNLQIRCLGAGTVDGAANCIGKNFFFARSLLVIITIEVTDDVSSYSGVTSVLAQWTQIR